MQKLLYYLAHIPPVHPAHILICTFATVQPVLESSHCTSSRHSAQLKATDFTPLTSSPQVIGFTSTRVYFCSLALILCRLLWSLTIVYTKSTPIFTVCPYQTMNMNVPIESSQIEKCGDMSLKQFLRSDDLSKAIPKLWSIRNDPELPIKFKNWKGDFLCWWHILNVTRGCFWDESASTVLHLHAIFVYPFLITFEVSQSTQKCEIRINIKPQIRNLGKIPQKCKRRIFPKFLISAAAWNEVPI